MSRRIFFDANLIGVARALESVDERIVYPGHPDYPLSQDVPDEQWLRYVGARDWCAILRDKRIRYRSPQQAVLKRFKVRAVVIATSRSLSVAENVDLLRKHWYEIERGLTGPPSFRHLTMSGIQTMLEYGVSEDRSGGGGRGG